MEVSRTCGQVRSQSLGACVNDMGLTERIKKTKPTSSEMDGRLEETNRRPLNHNSKEQRYLEEISHVLKSAKLVQEKNDIKHRGK